MKKGDPLEINFKRNPTFSSSWSRDLDSSFFPSISNSKVKMCWRWILVKKTFIQAYHYTFFVVKCFILEKFVSLSWIPVKTFQGGLLPKVLKLGFFYFNSCHGQIDVFYAIDWIISSLTKNNQHLMLYLTGRLYWQLLYNIKWWWKK